jgi:hypothetical protein
VAVGAIVSVTLLGLAPIRTNGHFATVLTILKITVVAGIGLAAFAFGDGSMAHFTQSGAAGTCENVEASARLGLAGFGAAVVGALWSFTGWSIVTYVAEEVRTPEKTLPRALISGSVILTAIYLVANAGYFYVLTPGEVASVPILVRGGRGAHPPDRRGRRRAHGRRPHGELLRLDARRHGDADAHGLRHGARRPAAQARWRTFPSGHASRRMRWCWSAPVPSPLRSPAPST